MSHFIRPHYLLIATLIVACFATISYGPSRVTAIAIGHVMRPAASVEAHRPPPARLVARASKYDVRGSPSISFATIEAVLKQYHSPAIGNGQSFYDLGVKYGVDPAYMLAFYVEESSAGTMGAAVATKSVGNIICAGWAGKCIGRFRAYDSYTQAAEDWYQLITGNLYIGAGLTTPEQILRRYAPDGENCSLGYAHTVERLVDEWRWRKSG